MAGNANALNARGFAIGGDTFIPQPYPLWAIHTDQLTGVRAVTLVIGWEVNSKSDPDTVVSPCFADLNFCPESCDHIDYSVTDPRTPEDLKSYAPPMIISACCEVGPITIKSCGCISPCPKCGECYTCKAHNKEDD